MWLLHALILRFLVNEFVLFFDLSTNRDTKGDKKETKTHLCNHRYFIFGLKKFAYPACITQLKTTKKRLNMADLQGYIQILGIFLRSCSIFRKPSLCFLQSISTDFCGAGFGIHFVSQKSFYNAGKLLLSNFRLMVREITNRHVPVRQGHC